jgi:hypothetical protein
MAMHSRGPRRLVSAKSMMGPSMARMISPGVKSRLANTPKPTSQVRMWNFPVAWLAFNHPT